MQKDSDQKFEKFKKWFQTQGGLAHKIKFPQTFPPTGYVGMAAKEDIKANEVFLAIPKHLIISIQRVRESQIGPILQKYDTLNDSSKEETQFNILTLFLIKQKMQGQSSFYNPYLQVVEKAQTIISWTDQDIQKLGDPHITVQFVNQLRKQFPPIFQQFKKIVSEHPQIFKQPLTWQLFMQCYAIVMTRCFGWGLPQTMLVPYADFLNHSCHGVHHYMFNKALQSSTDCQEYLRKRKQLDLSIFGINNKAELPKSYVRNAREKFIFEHQQQLQKAQQTTNSSYSCDSRLYSNQTKEYLDIIHKQLLQNNYDVEILASTNSEDNDSEDDDVSEEEIKQKVYCKQLTKLIKQQIGPKFEQPKPLVNRQFEDDITFNWWHQTNEKQCYFIVAADRFIAKKQQIFNSYGRRSNKFLLTYYGFAYSNNKYDSVAFRFWDEEVYANTGRLIFVKTLTEKDWIEKLSLGNQRYSYASVSDQYRLKRQNLCYQLMAYLRLRIIRRKQNFKSLFAKKLITLHKIQNLQLQRLMLEDYSNVLKHVCLIYQPDRIRQQLSQPHRNYFAKILAQSNKQIIMAHINGIAILKNVIARLQKGTQLNDVYHNNLSVQQEELSKNNANTNLFKTIRYKNRLFINDYFKMLSKYFQRAIKK